MASDFQPTVLSNNIIKGGEGGGGVAIAGEPASSRSKQLASQAIPKASWQTG